MKSWAHEQLAMLQPLYEGWDLWIVPHYPNSYVWCARPAGTPLATINAGSPEELVRMIAEQETAQEGLLTPPATHPA
jgi:hypothetical protein